LLFYLFSFSLRGLRTGIQPKKTGEKIDKPEKTKKAENKRSIRML